MLSWRSLTVIISLAGVSGLLAQMTPNAPVKNFSLPRFGEQGFTEWVLKGEKGIYDGPEQVRVEEMGLRIYSGDERLALEMTLDSPFATIRLKENTAFSDELIEIEGSNFKITGIGWEWIGATREILVKSKTLVEFDQAISGGLNQSQVVTTSGSTEISSEQLVLQTTASEYHFEFNGNVNARSGEWTLESNFLEVLAEPPEDRKSEAKLNEASKIDAVRQVTAREDVLFLQGGQVVRAGEAVFYPNEGKAVLRERPSIEVAGAYITGELVESRSGEVIITGSPEGGRAQMILTDTGGLGIEGAAALSSETILLADTITLTEDEEGHDFIFEGRVEAFSGEVQLTSERMQVVATSSKGPAYGPAASGSSLNVGLVEYLHATGNVRVDRSGQIAMSEEMFFYPDESRAVLKGSPEVTNGTALVRGNIMELQPDIAIVRGLPNAPLEVELPKLPDLGYHEIVATEKEEESAVEVAEVETRSTFIRSQLLNMIDEEGQTVFRFTGDVDVTATNLQARCSRLDAIALPLPEGSEGELALQRIEAYDDVWIEQGDRVAEAGRASILPEAGKLVLQDKAVVNDPRGRVTGHKLTINRGQQRVVVEGGGTTGERARITLPGLMEGKF